MPRADKALELREEHVRRFIANRGIRDPRVIGAMRRVPREQFVPEASLADAYGDHPLPIGCGQTISQPYMVAWMTDALDLSPSDRVLEVGTGSGYQTAILAELVDEVYSVEYYPALSEGARRALERMGYTNVRFRVGDGSVGWEEAAPFDAICVTAGAPKVPWSLKEQLRDGGRLAIPVGDRHVQDFVLVTRCGASFREEKLGGCRFVPLVGEEGWGKSEEETSH